MGLDNPIHIAFLLILLLLVFGAKRLPEMGKLARQRHARLQGVAQRREQHSRAVERCSHRPLRVRRPLPTVPRLASRRGARSRVPPASA